MKSIYFYNDISLYKYCVINGLNYRDCVKRIKKHHKANPQISLENSIKVVMRNPTTPNDNKSEIFCYGGTTLYQYCLKHNLSYRSKLNGIRKYLRANPNISTDKAISTIMQRENNVDKYFYGNITLYQYCKRKGFEINDAYKRIKRLINQDGKTLEEAINDTVNYYERKRYTQNVTKIFTYLKTTPNIDSETLEKIANYLNVDFNNFLHLTIDKKFGVATAMALIWYFHDNDKDKLLSISHDRIKEILHIIRLLPTLPEKEIKYYDFGYLFGIYKTGLLDTRYLITIREKAFIYQTILNMQGEFNLNLNKDKLEDLYDDVSLHLLELLDKIDSNVIARVILYLTKSLR